MFEYPITIRELHLDSYGHVNNATYLNLFEEARWEAITRKGYGYQKVHETRQGPVILEIQMKFLKELKLRENIKITLEVVSYEGKLFRLLQKMVKENNEIACEMNMVGGFFDLNERKLILPTQEWLFALGK